MITTSVSLLKPVVVVNCFISSNSNFLFAQILILTVTYVFAANVLSGWALSILVRVSSGHLWVAKLETSEEKKRLFFLLMIQSHCLSPGHVFIHWVQMVIIGSNCACSQSCERGRERVFVITPTLLKIWDSVPTWDKKAHRSWFWTKN